MMIAVIRTRAYKAQTTVVTVKDKLIDGMGYVRIVATDGTIYETHLSNVVFIDDGGKYGKE